MKIAVDFDGTVVTDAYPEVGKPLPFALQTLKELSKEHQIILWTCRVGHYLDDAVKLLEDGGVKLYAINKNFPDEETSGSHFMRKIDADMFIDDRNFGGFPGWSAIWKSLGGNAEPEPPKKKKWFWQR
ncbi:MAG: hypothetical protein MJZ66_00015 [Bacteroidales bacterium]|nr:hypothetical protein [Bacteroidales bacterium]